MDTERRSPLPYTGEPLSRQAKPRPKPKATEGTLRLILLGTLTLKSDGEEKTAFATRKVGLILAYLGLDPGKPVAREWLRELFWPDASEPDGRNALSVALSRLRRDLGDPTLLQSDRWTVSLDAERVDSDVRRFRAYLRGVATGHTETGRMAQAIRVLREYRGPLLPGCEEPWAVGERTSLAESHSRAVGGLLDYVERYGDLNGSVDEVRAALPMLVPHHRVAAQARLETILRTMPKPDGLPFVRAAQTGSASTVAEGGWDAARDFSPAYNPNGPWSYGWSWGEDFPMQPALFGDLLWSGEVSVPLWRAAMYAYPCLARNEAADPFVYETLTIPRGALMMHPGPVGQVAVFRWAAPHAGRFQIRLRIFAISPDATTGVALRSPSGTLWSHDYRAELQPETQHDRDLELAEGGWIEVRVDDDYISDSTGIDLAILALEDA